MQIVEWSSVRILLSSQFKAHRITSGSMSTRLGETRANKGVPRDVTTSRNEGVPGSSPGVGFERGPRILCFGTRSTSSSLVQGVYSLSLERLLVDADN